MAVYGDQRVFSAEGQRRDSTPLFLFNAAGEVVDTVGVWLAREWNYASIQDGRARTRVGFGRELAFAGRNGYSILSSTDSLDASLFDPTGRLIMTLAGGGPAIPVTDEDIAAWRRSEVERMSNSPEELRRVFLEAPHHMTYPAFGGLFIDRDRRIWIGTYVRPTDSEQTWIILGSEGALEGALSIPRGARLLDAAGERIALLRTDALGEERVHVLRRQD
jgi:hypothetical protein